MTTSSRRAKSLIARPRISSLLPSEISVRGVEEVDTCFERLFDERPALLLRETPGMIAEIATAVAHAAEANARDIETGAAELGIFHRLSKPVKSIMRSAG